MENIITHPLFATFFGWFAFQLLMLSIYKDENEKTFNIGAYSKDNWDNWLSSFFMIPVILFIGAKGLDLNPLSDNSSEINWHDGYYVGVGFITELVRVAWKKWKAKNQ